MWCMALVLRPGFHLFLFCCFVYCRWRYVSFDVSLPCPRKSQGPSWAEGAMDATYCSVVVSAMHVSDQKNLAVWEEGRATGDGGEL